MILFHSPWQVCDRTPVTLTMSVILFHPPWQVCDRNPVTLTRSVILSLSPVKVCDHITIITTRSVTVSLSPWQGLWSYSYHPDIVCDLIPFTMTSLWLKLSPVTLTKSVCDRDKVCDLIPFTLTKSVRDLILITLAWSVILFHSHWQNLWSSPWQVPLTMARSVKVFSSPW